MNFEFDAELIGANGALLPVHCEVQPPYVGGQKALIQISVPAKYISENPPDNPCTLSGKSGAFTISMQGVHWRRFPTSSRTNLRLEAIELLHVESLTIRRPLINDKKEIRFHLAPISYLRTESNCVLFGDSLGSHELFVLDLPNLGATRFVAEWVTIHHRYAEIPGATVVAGFSAVAALPVDGLTHADEIVAEFKSSLDILSVLFRQAVSLHGWTYSDGQTVSKWHSPLDPNVSPSAQENRGDFVARPQVFAECATSLAHAYGKADAEIRWLVRRLAVAVNPHNTSRTNDRFLFMFSTLERVIESAWKRDQTPHSPPATNQAVIQLLKQLKEDVVAKGDENAPEISARLTSLISDVNRTTVREMFEAFLRVYPEMSRYCADLWPILGSGQKRGLKDVRNDLAHGRSSSVSHDVVAVAEWHLAILLERVIFALLKLDLPEGISPGSFLLRRGGRGWYERNWWGPLRSEPGEPT